MISISELEAARVGMSKPEHWHHNETNYRCIEVNGNDDIWVDDSCDARGLVATIKAADVLIEIAKAAMVWSRTLHGDRCAELDALTSALAKVMP